MKIKRNQKGQFIKGHNVPKEFIEKCKEKNKGKRYSIKTEFKKGEHRSLNTEFKKGHISIAGFKKGHKVSEKIKQKIRETNKKTESWKRFPQGRGINCPAWKGGFTPIVANIRGSIKYISWRSNVFMRDNFTCQKCGQVGGELEAHHIKSFSKLIQEVKKYLPLLSLYEGAMIYTPLWDLKNGITLCKKCHRRIKR